MRLYLLVGVALSSAWLTIPIAAAASKTITLYSFGQSPDGSYPYGGLVSDTSGNLYGTTQIGGSAGYGIVFELSPPATGQKTWSETILHSFQGGADGSAPNGGLVFDTAGNLYGTTYAGGSANAGTVFKLTPPASGQTAWSEAVLYAFQGGTDGLNPAAGLTLGRNGVLYGTTQSGGAYGDGSLFNGTVFELTPPKPKQTVMDRDDLA